MCKGMLKSGQATLRCIHCGEAIHLAFQLKQFKDAGNEAPKNKIEWLGDFIKFAALAHRCKACQENQRNCAASSVVTATASDPQVSQEIANMKQSIAALDSKISSVLTSISSINGNLFCAQKKDVSSANHITASSEKSDIVKSYATTVGCDLPSIVKTVVNESVKAQRNNERDKSSVVIYGLQESNNDLAKVRGLLQVCDCADSVVRISRLGKPVAGSDGANSK